MVLMAESANKKFMPNRNYRFGRIRDGGNKIRLQWLSKPRSMVVPGSTLIENGTPTTRDFWSKNPLAYPLKQIHMIAEIDPQTQEEIVFDTGSFLSERQPQPGGLSDQPIVPETSGEKMNAQTVRVYEGRIEDLKKDVTDSRAETIQLRTDLDAERKSRLAEVTKLKEEIMKLKDENREKDVELKFITEKVIPKYKEQEAQGLNDSTKFTQATEPFQRQLADQVVSKGMELIEKFFGGSSRQSSNGAQHDKPTESKAGLTSKDLGIAEVE